MGKTLFVDLDGTIARFYEINNYLEHMYEKGCFLNLRAYKEMIEAIKKIINEKKIRVIFHTAYPAENSYAPDEKRRWLKEKFDLDDFELIIVPAPADKAKEAEKYLGRAITKSDFLLDDYTANLKVWENAGGSGIKCVNEIQDKTDAASYTGPRVSATDDEEYIYNYLMRLFEEKEDNLSSMVITCLDENGSYYHYTTKGPIVPCAYNGSRSLSFQEAKRSRRTYIALERVIDIQILD